MTTKSTKKKSSGKQNRPFQQTSQESSKIQTKLNPNQFGQYSKLSQSTEPQNTSTTLTSNLSLNVLSESNVQNSSQTSTQNWHQISITQIDQKKEGISENQEELNKGKQTEQKEEGKKSKPQKNQGSCESKENNIFLQNQVQGQVEKVEKQQEQKIKKTQKKDDYEQYQWASNLIKEYEETVESEKNWKQEKQVQGQEDQTIMKHYILPDTMFQGQFTYVTKEKKQQDVEEQLQQLQEEKKQLQISTEHYINPTTVVQGQISQINKELKKLEIQKEVKQVQQIKQELLAEQKAIQKPKVIPRANLHQFHSYEVPELHQQDIPLQHQVEQLPVNLHQEIQKPSIIPIIPLLPVSIEQKTQQEKINPLFIDVPKKQQLPPQYEHYIIPGTMFQGQFTYVTKQKKEEQIQEQLQHLQEEKRQLQISTQHYINPTTIVQGRIPQATKELKKQEIEKELKKTDKQKAFLKEKKYQRKSQPNIQISDLQEKTNLSKVSSFQMESMKLQKTKDLRQGSMQFQITSNLKKPSPLKIDQQSAMTILSTKKEQKSTFVLPYGQEPNYDLEFLVLDANLNKQSQSPKNVLQTKPTNLLNMNQIPEMIGQLKTKDGSPLKVVIGTKQFANFPNQVSPSPPIIDQQTLRKLRKINEQQMKKTGQTVSPPPKVYVSKSSDQSFTYEKVVKNPDERVNQFFTIKNIRQEPILLQDFQDLKPKRKTEKTGKNQDQQPSLTRKVLRSLGIASIIGCFAWISFKDSKITVASATMGLAISMIAQNN